LVVAPDRFSEGARRITVPEGRVWAKEEFSGDPPVLVLHGFPTSSEDFAGALSHLSRRRRVVLFDFLGYGRSDKPRQHGYSLFEQADVAVAVARAFGVTSAHVFAHDMGTSVATELLARRERGLLPFGVESLVLMNGSVFIEMAHLTLGQKLLLTRAGDLFAKMNTRWSFERQMRGVFARPPPAEELRAMWDLVARDDGTRRLPQLIRYVEDRQRFKHRWNGALSRFDRPTLVAWGRKDPVAVFPIAERLARTVPGAKLVSFDDLGHYPQIEDPARVAKTVEDFWEGLSGPRAGVSASP
jgi:pimeloyl-ACP methyl ester carboxylesterase